MLDRTQILGVLAFILALVAITPTIVRAQGISQLQQFTSTTSPASAITQTVFGKPFRLTGQGSGCAQFSANGTLTSTGIACGSGGGASFAYPFPSNATSTQITFNGGLVGALTGNASTATSLAANGTNASAGNAILGVDASGNAEGAFDVWTEAENTAAAYINATQDIKFSTTSANYWKSLGLAFSTTSADYWETQQAPRGGSSFAYPFPSNATTTLLSFNGGASTTLFSSNYASSTLYYGAGLSTCNTGNMLTWAAGKFGCEADDGGAGSGTVNAGTTGQAAFYAADGTAVSGTSSITFEGNAVSIFPGGNFTGLNIWAPSSNKTEFYSSVLGGGSFDVNVQNTSTYLDLFNGSDGYSFATNAHALLLNTGNTGIGTSSPYAKLSVVGEVVGSHFTATTTNPSTFPYASTTAVSGTSLCIGSDCRTSWPSAGSSFSYPFPSNATTTLIAFNGGLTSASTTLTGPFVFANATGTNATTTSLFATNARFTGATTSALAISGITNGLLSTNTNGSVVATTSLSISQYLTGTLPVANGGTGSTTLTGILVGNGTAPLQTATVSGPLSFSGTTLSITQATTGTNGYLSSTDFTTFNNKISSSSLSGGAGISYNSSTGVITNIIGYPFPSDATTTLINFSTGLRSASTTLSGPFVFANATGSAATTTNLAVSSIASGNLVKTTTGGALIAAVAGIDFTTQAGVAASIAASYPFPANATTTLLSFNGGASTTLFSANYASSTKWNGGGLGTDCDGDNQGLGWDATLMQFVCGDDDSGGAASAGGSDTQVQFNDGGSAIGGAVGFVWDKVRSLVGIGSTTPWAVLSVASSTPDYRTPLFAVSTSTNEFGSLMTLFATSTSLSLLNNPRSYVNDSGVRLGIGTRQSFDAGMLLDQFTLNGRLNTGDWHMVELAANTGQDVTANTNGIHGTPWAYIEDGTGQVLSTINRNGMMMLALCNDSISACSGTSDRSNAASGQGLFLPNVNNAANGFTAATSTPILETVAKIVYPEDATSTAFYIGFVNLTNFSTLETPPTQGCYFTASSTAGANWLAMCKTSATSHTIVDTGFASSTVLSGATFGNNKGFYRFRIQMDNNGATFYMASSTAPLRQVARITTTYPATTALKASIYYGQIVGGLSQEMDINYARLWYYQPILSY